MIAVSRGHQCTPSGKDLPPAVLLNVPLPELPVPGVERVPNTGHQGYPSI